MAVFAIAIKRSSVTLWYNVSFNNQEFITRIQWIQGQYPFRATNLEYINPLTTKRIDIASFLKFSKDEVCGINYINARLQQKISLIIKIKSICGHM